jgi:threonine/homoserine/homoserine lactone efflux protein
VPSAHTTALFAVTALALLVIPGPAVLYIVTRSIDQGRRAGLASVVGIHTGTIVHVAAAAAGLSALLLASASAFTALKLAGAAYLVALGVRKLMHRGNDDADGSEVAPVALRHVYTQGIIVNVLNPKTALFFVAFLPQFVDPARGAVAGQIVFLGTLFIVLGLCSDSCYALLAEVFGRRLRSSARFVRRRDVFSGCMYIGLGVVAAIAGHSRQK